MQPVRSRLCRNFFIAGTSLAMAAALGCASGGGVGAPAAPSLPVPGGASRDLGAAPSAASTTPDPSAVSSDEITSPKLAGSARDLDLGGGGGANGALSFQQLGAMLQSFCPDAVAGDGTYCVKAKKTISGIDWNFPIYVDLSKDGSIIYISCVLLSPQNQGYPSGQGLLNLLAANTQIEPCFFGVDTQGREQLVLGFPNKSVDAAELASNLKFFFNVLVGTEPMWYSAGGAPGGGEPGGGQPQPAPAPGGGQPGPSAPPNPFG